MNSRPWIIMLLLFPAIIAMYFLASCKSYEEKNKELPDTYRRGMIRVSADESFKPVIDAQVQVYESNHPNARIMVEYKPEADCLRDMLVDSVRMIIATRGNTQEELEAVADSLQTELKSLVVARDVIAVIVHPESEDSFFTMSEIREILNGRFKKNLIPSSWHQVCPFKN